jgi:hypothetical protein
VWDQVARMWTREAAVAPVAARARAVAQEPLASESRGPAALARILTAGARQVQLALS